MDSITLAQTQGRLMAVVEILKTKQDVDKTDLSFEIKTIQRVIEDNESLFDD